MVHRPPRSGVSPSRILSCVGIRRDRDWDRTRPLGTLVVCPARCEPGSRQPEQYALDPGLGQIRPEGHLGDKVRVDRAAMSISARSGPGYPFRVQRLANLPPSKMAVPGRLHHHLSHVQTPLGPTGRQACVLRGGECCGCRISRRSCRTCARLHLDHRGRRCRDHVLGDAGLEARPERALVALLERRFDVVAAGVQHHALARGVVAQLRPTGIG